MQSYTISKQVNIHRLKKIRILSKNYVIKFIIYQIIYIMFKKDKRTIKIINKMKEHMGSKNSKN